MLIRVNGGTEGIRQYLIHGVKSGRAFGRDRLDDRLVLLGDLDTAYLVISGMNNAGEKYYHITLSFFEDSLPDDVYLMIATEFANFAGAAYRSDEVCFYAEAHIPRIKSYKARSGETVLRKPHIHVVVPKANLLTGKVVDLFGNIRQNIEYIDAFQEYINEKYGLVSPKERRRVSFADESTVLSREKNDDFSGSARNLKQSILNSILAKGVTSQDDFRELLESIGKVKLCNSGRTNAYWKLTPEGASKSVNLKDFAFSDNFICMSASRKEEFLTHGRIVREVSLLEIQGVGRTPSKKHVDKLQNWTSQRAHEIRLVGRSEKLRRQYKEMTILQQKLEFLQRIGNEHLALLKIEWEEMKNVDRTGHNEYGAEHVSARGADGNGYGRPWWDHEEHGAVRPASLSAAPNLHDVRGLPSRHLVGRAGRPKELLHVAAGGELDGRRADAPDEMRWAVLAPARRIVAPTNLPGHYLRQAARQRDQMRVRAYSRALEQACSGQDVQAALEQSYGLPKTHLFIKRKDASLRVLLGAEFVELDTFLTDHMRLEWQQSLDLLRAAARMRAGQIQSTAARVRRMQCDAEVLGFKALPFPMAEGTDGHGQALYMSLRDGQASFEVAASRINVVSLDRYSVGAALGLAAQRFGESLEISGSPAFLSLAQDLARDMRLQVKVAQLEPNKNLSEVVEEDCGFDDQEGHSERPRGN